MPSSTQHPNYHSYPTQLEFDFDFVSHSLVPRASNLELRASVSAFGQGVCEMAFAVDSADATQKKNKINKKKKGEPQDFLFGQLSWPLTLASDNEVKAMLDAGQRQLIAAEDEDDLARLQQLPTHFVTHKPDT